MSGGLVGMWIGRSRYSMVLKKNPKNPKTPKNFPPPIILKKILIIFPEVIVVMTSQIFRNFGTIALKSECPKFSLWIPTLMQSIPSPFLHSGLVQWGVKKNKNGKYSYTCIEHWLVFSLDAPFYKLAILWFLVLQNIISSYFPCYSCRWFWIVALPSWQHFSLGI